MKKTLILLSILISSFFGSTAYTKCRQIRVAIIDTGLDVKDPRFTPLLCKDGHHFDFVVDKPLETDFHGHGTHITGLVKQYAGNSNYCLLVYRYYDNSGLGYNNLKNEIRAIKQAIDDKADIINISGGGAEPVKSECELIRNSKNITFVLAAGNDGHSIDPPGGYYPACCGSPNIVVVGSVDKNGTRLSSSNFGKMVTSWELGLNVLSTLPDGKMGTMSTMSGTSQATAIATGKMISQKQRVCK